MSAPEMEDWSLQAIVRGSSGEFSNVLDAQRLQDYDNKSFLDFSGMHQQIDREFFESFPEIFDVGMDSRDGLEELYKPFYPIHPQNMIEFQENRNESGVEDKQNIESDQSFGADKGSKGASTPKYKRRKNQQKRVVIQVSADGLASDKWAWRKYGQKPIKGSPYPRSYYRCSSSKGCLARKQVEQSCTDPGMLIITYTAEHSHSQPTRRNSLSGTIRQKFPSPKSPIMINVKQEKTSPEVDFHQERIKQEEPVFVAGERSDYANDFDHMSDDLMFNDGFFSGLEDFDDFLSEISNPSSSSPLFSTSSCS